MQDQKPKVLLIYPKTGMDIGSTVAPPHALLTIAAPLLKAGYCVKIIDERTESASEDILSHYISSDLICVGISTMTGTQIRNALNIAKIIRKLTHVPLIWGGVHPTILPEQTLEHDLVDIIAIGEGDETLIELVKAIENKTDLSKVKGIMYTDGGKSIKTEERPLLEMDSLLPIPWELIDVEKYIHRDMYLKTCKRVLDLGQTSRGCPYQCGFCCSATIRKRKWRPMSAEKSLAMIVDGVRRFNLDGLWLRDDEFYINRSRANTICEGMIRENLNVSFYTSGTRVDVFMKASDEEIATLKRAGAYTLKFGAESGSQRTLDLMKKGITVEQTLQTNLRCKKFGIIPAFALIIGYPTETFEDIDKTIDLAYRLKSDNKYAELESIATYTALPGTPDFNFAIEHGLRPPQSLQGWVDWTFDGYDLEGAKIPWFNKQHRRYIGNITNMSILANALENIMGSIDSKPISYLAKWVAKPVSFYFKARLKNKMYKNVPEMPLIWHLKCELFHKDLLKNNDSSYKISYSTKI